MSETKLIYKKVAAIMSEVGAIGKDRKNQSQGYNFRGIDDVYNAVHENLVRHGVFCTPQVIKAERSERTSNSGTTLLYSIVEMKYTFFAEDGSSIEVSTIGEGMDSGDKATNKAMSAAQKYAFIQLFCIPTKEAKDSENDSPSVGHGSSSAQPGQRQDEIPPFTPLPKLQKVSGDQAPACPQCSKAMGISKFPDKVTGINNWYCFPCKKSLPRTA